MNHIDAEELVATVERLEDRVDDLEAENRRLSNSLEYAHDRIDDLETENEELREDIRTAEKRLHSQRTRVESRVAELEDEVGIETALADTHSPLTLLDRVGPEAVTDNPGVTLRRAHALVTNRDRWGEVRSNKKYGTHLVLATRRHNLREHLEDHRGESLHWRQVHRAMERVAKLATGGVELDEHYGDEENGGKALVWLGGGDDR